MTFPVPLIRHHIPMPSRRRSGRPLEPGVRFIVAHDTGNPGSTAFQNARYYASTANAESTSAHLFVDHDGAVECVPCVSASPPEKAWHVRYDVPKDDALFGVNANDAAIAVEYCYGAGIDADRAYANYVAVLAWLCRTYGLNAAVQIVGHFVLDPGRRTDPATGLARSGRTYEQLLRDVAAAMAPVPEPVRDMPQNARFRTSTRLNLRRGRPSRSAEIERAVAAGTELSSVAFTDDGENINGIARWYRDAAGSWFWSGPLERID